LPKGKNEECNDDILPVFAFRKILLWEPISKEELE